MKIYRGTRLANFEELDRNIATFEISASEKLSENHRSPSSDHLSEECDYSQFPDLSDGIFVSR